jgi:hypothetical protein
MSANYRRGLTVLVVLLVTVLGMGKESWAQQVYELPAGKVGTEYEFRIETEGGQGALTWRVVEPTTLPPGLELHSSGVLKGTPAEARDGAYEFVIEVSDSSDRFAQAFRLRVRKPLRMVLPAASLRIVLPEKEAVTANGPGSGSATGAPPPPPPVSGPSTAPPSPSVASLAEARLPAKPATSVSAARITTSATNSGNSRSNDKNNEQRFDPASFIRIYEHTNRGVWKELYPGKSGDKRRRRPRHLTADEDSIILVEPVPRLMGEDLPLNKLYVSAKLAKDNESNPVEVVGYSEVGKARETAEAQRGMAFQTAQNIQNMMLNMAFTAKDIIHYVCEKPEMQVNVAFPDDCEKNESGLYKAIRSMRDGEQQRGPLERLQNRFRLFEPEINEISDFFLQERNLGVVELLGTEVFWMDRESLQAVARQYKENLGLAFGAESSIEAKATALSELWERTKIVYKDFREVRLEIQKMLEAVANEKYEEKYPLEKGEERTETEELLLQLQPKLKELLPRLETVELKSLKREEINELLLAQSYAVEIYSNWWRQEAFEKTKKLVATGSVSLREAAAEDGNRLTLTIEARGAEGESVGIPAVFEIAIKQYGAKIKVSPSFFFVKRLGIDDSDVNPPMGSGVDPVREVNFAPAPGMTFGLTFFKRGDSAWDKFWRGLAPGAGVNVSFMNFDDPSFDLASGMFTNTTGTNVQVGAGPAVGLFNNMVQFTYGWNLNADRKRRYFGVGFGFIEIANEVKKYVKGQKK